MSHTENTGRTRKSIYLQARMLSKVEDNGKRKLENIFNRYPDKWIIYIWNAFNNTVCQMLVKITSSKKIPINNVWVTTLYSSSLRVPSCPACLTLNRRKVTSMLCSTEIFIMDCIFWKGKGVNITQSNEKESHFKTERCNINSAQAEPCYRTERNVNLDSR